MICSMGAKPILVSWDISCIKHQAVSLYVYLHDATSIFLRNAPEHSEPPLGTILCPLNHADNHQKLGDIIFLVWPRLGFLRPIEPLEDLVRNPRPCPEEGKIKDCTCMKSTNRTGTILGIRVQRF